MFYVAITNWVGLTLALCSAAVASCNSSSIPYATLFNFAPKDVLEGDDGLPPHPLQPLPYGKPVYPATATGDGLERIEAHLSYWEGQYYMYSATWGCGGSLFYYGTPPDGDYPASPVYSPGDYGADGNCGVKTFASTDLTNWSLVDFYQPSITVANVTKPLVRYSNATGQYVMFMGGDAMVGIYYATSTSPGGPWSSPPGELLGQHLSHDFDVFEAPNGTHYIITDPFMNRINNPKGSITWDIWVQELAPNLTATVNTSNTTTLVRSAADLIAQNLTLEASGAFYKNGYYYLTFGMTCQNCAGYIYYYYSESPLGPYRDGGFISRDGCGGQNKGANVLPTPDGDTVIVAGNLGYRTGPTNYVYYGWKEGYIFHADNQQAASSTFFFPLEFNEDHTIKPYTCPGEVKIPLMNSENGKSPEPPVPYQLDCRVRNWRTVEATYAEPKAASVIEFSVWQRTDNLGPTTNSGPMLDGLLEVTLIFAEGLHDTFTWPASNISWAPAKISMDITGKSVTKIVISTNATNGCYGTMVHPKTNQSSQYGTRALGKYSVQ